MRNGVLALWLSAVSMNKKNHFAIMVDLSIKVWKKGDYISCSALSNESVQDAL